MEVRVHGPGEDPEPLAVTLRTPGDDFDLAVGMLVAEGVVRDADDVAGIEYCVGPSGTQEFNIVTVRTTQPVGGRLRERTLVAHAGCGLCGTRSLDDLTEPQAPAGRDGDATIDVPTVTSLPERLREHQDLFGATGGLHAAGRFTLDGAALDVCEDVGRHNAVDKLVGAATMAGALPLRREVLMLSGRAGYELVLKAALAGFPIVVSVSAPTNLAVRVARRHDMTLCGFVRDGRVNVYTGASRLGYADGRGAD